MVIIFSNKKKNRFYYSLKWKLFISFFLVCSIPLVFVAFTMINTIEEYFKEVNEKEMIYQANKIAGSIQKANYLEDKSKKIIFDNEIDERSKEGAFRILVIDSSGVVVNDSNKTDVGMTYLVPEVIVALEGKDIANLRDDEGVIYASAYIENDKSEKIGVVLLVSSFDEIFLLLENISHKLIILFCGVIVIIGIVVMITSNLIVIEPLKNILSNMQMITDGQLHHRIDVKGHDEFSELSEAFNNMTEELEQGESSRQEFVSNVSHELKTPLSSIKVLSDSILLMDEVPVEMYKEFLQDINSEIDRMTNIVNDLLSLVKLDHREAGLNIQETDVNKMVEELIKRLTPLADHKLIEIIYENNKKMDIEADEMKLTLAISNLIENAIKYTPDEGSVTIIVDGDHQNAFISVIDTGIGISEEEQSKVFKRFYRVDKTRDRETGGTGLGLAITHSTVLLHNGSIKLTSKEGQGSTFVVRLPIKHSEP